MDLMKYWRTYHFVKMKSSILINYLTNMCQSGQGPMIQITSLRKVTVGIIGGGRRGWDPCVCGFSIISWRSSLKRAFDGVKVLCCDAWCRKGVNS
jgi:hypothetical protein